MQAAEVANASANAALASLPDRSELLLLLKAHEDHAALVERRAKGEVVVAERTADEAATGQSLAAADRVLAEARAAEEAAAAAHRAHAVRADLVAGDPCPVCLQLVTSVPAEPPAPELRASKKRREKAEREQHTALEAHWAAQHASTVATTTLSQVAADLEAVEGELDGRPTRAETITSVDAVEAARLDCDKASRVADVARGSSRDAMRARDELAEAERTARDRYDAVRDEVAALGPPGRLGGDAALVDEWCSLVEWAATEADQRRGQATQLVERALAAGDRRAEQVAGLVERCRVEAVGVPEGAEPSGAARQALGQATADHGRLGEQLAVAQKLRGELEVVETRRDVARGLATHLDARHFEKWVLDEALTALAEGATEVLSVLSGGQYALRVDPKGGFLVVDHRNAGELRTARTLSGGETFLASLALALALADRIAVLAAHGAARLESIFLDEGFGTLDADTLDTVTTAIEELGASGRLVGVVSHVADLAERLPVRFEVSRSGNASTIERVDR
jgi:exonuclease SbcC